MKYLLIEIEERNGEQEYRQHYLKTYSGKKTNEQVADQVCSKWYMGKSEHVDDMYYFDGGSIGASVLSVKEIPKEHFEILKLYNI